MSWFSDLINTLHGTDYSSNQNKAIAFMQFYAKEYNSFNKTSLTWEELTEKIAGSSYWKTFLESYGAAIVRNNNSLDIQTREQLSKLAQRPTLVFSTELYTLLIDNKAGTIQDIKETGEKVVSGISNIFLFVLGLLVVLLLLKVFSFVEAGKKAFA